ncbi:MAG TPA: NFACT RNA binding domain-containing protein, partial [Candidatus Bipolaricaulis anaerobius]|nr:NFACT RNA binding domain-containing protein [Candidatus Bipolaricaulis anaerobius]
TAGRAPDARRRARPGAVPARLWRRVGPPRPGVLLAGVRRCGGRLVVGFATNLGSAGRCGRLGGGAPGPVAGRLCDARPAPPTHQEQPARDERHSGGAADREPARTPPRATAAARVGHPPAPEELAAFAADLLAQAPAGYLYRTASGRVASFFPRPDLGEPDATFPSFSEALDHLLEQRLGVGLARDQLDQVERALRRRERALAALAAAEAEAQNWQQFQAQADLILTRIADIPRGAAVAVVEGSDGRPVELELNPARPPAAQARALYAKAKKLRRRLARTPARREELAAEIRRLRELRDLLTQEPHLAPYVAGETAALAPASPREKPAPAARPRELVVEGFPIQIGRSGEENDRLVQGARPHDLWLHARGVPGAHVIIRTEGRPVPREVLERAAELAAWHSRARGERKVPISYTEARYVRKRKGAPPGMVTLQREEVLVVPGDRGP